MVAIMEIIEDFERVAWLERRMKREFSGPGSNIMRTISWEGMQSW